MTDWQAKYNELKANFDDACRMLADYQDEIAKLREAGEPVAWMTADGRVASKEARGAAMPNVSRVLFNIPLYAAPQSSADENAVIAAFLERSGQWLTNDATHAAALAEARNTALEEAAQVCEAYERQILQSRRDNRAQHFMGASVGASACADRIRALKSAPAAEDSAKGAGDDLRKIIDNLDRSLGQTIDERDRYHRIADMLANAIAEHFGVDIGEHSSANCPWTNALDAFPAVNADRPQRGGDMSKHAYREAVAHLETLAAFGGTLTQARELAAKGVERSAALAAQPAASAEPVDYERRHAIKEGERNAAAFEYFSARATMMDTLHNRRIFEAGFDRGYDAAPAAALAAHQPDGGDAKDAARYRCFRAAMVNENAAWLDSIEDALVAMGCTPEIVPTAKQVDAAFDAAQSAQQGKGEGGQS